MLSPSRVSSVGVDPRVDSYHCVLSKELAARGFFNELGKPYAAKSVASMLR